MNIDLKLAMGLFWFTAGLIILGGALLVYFTKKGKTRKR